MDNQYTDNRSSSTGPPYNQSNTYSPFNGPQHRTYHSYSSPDVPQQQQQQQQQHNPPSFALNRPPYAQYNQPSFPPLNPSPYAYQQHPIYKNPNQPPAPYYQPALSPHPAASTTAAADITTVKNPPTFFSPLTVFAPCSPFCKFTFSFLLRCHSPYYIAPLQKYFEAEAYLSTSKHPTASSVTAYLASLVTGKMRITAPYNDTKLWKFAATTRIEEGRPKMEMFENTDWPFVPVTMVRGGELRIGVVCVLGPPPLEIVNGWLISQGNCIDVEGLVGDGRYQAMVEEEMALDEKERKEDGEGYIIRRREEEEVDEEFEK